MQELRIKGGADSSRNKPINNRNGYRSVETVYGNNCGPAMFWNGRDELPAIVELS